MDGVLLLGLSKIKTHRWSNSLLLYSNTEV